MKSQCKKEWSVRKDGILEDLKVPFSKFILAVKLFILEIPAYKAHKELDLAYNTTHKIYTKLRQCIYKFVSKMRETIKKVKRGSLIYKINSKVMMVL
jgi:transposase